MPRCRARISGSHCERAVIPFCGARLSARIAGQQVVEDVRASTSRPRGVTATARAATGSARPAPCRAILGLIERTGICRTRRASASTASRPTESSSAASGTCPRTAKSSPRSPSPRTSRLAERGRRTRTGTWLPTLFPDLGARGASAAGTLSGGQQQMVSLARALLNDNRLLLVDEPTKGLWPQLVTDVADALGDVPRETVPILLVEQNLQVVRRLAFDASSWPEAGSIHTGPAARTARQSRARASLLGVLGVRGAADRRRTREHHRPAADHRPRPRRPVLPGGLWPVTHLRPHGCAQLRARLVPDPRRFRRMGTGPSNRRRQLAGTLFASLAGRGGRRRASSRLLPSSC